MSFITRAAAKRQPYNKAEINWANPITNGLLFAKLGSSRIPDYLLSTTPTYLRTGTKIVPFQDGLCEGFNTTVGIGATDHIRLPIAESPTKRSILVYFNARAAGGSNLGTLVTRGTNIVGRESELYLNNGCLAFNFVFSTTTGIWTFETSPVYNTWRHLIITYDASSTANDPSLYINGIQISHVSKTAPAGTRKVGTTPWGIGSVAGSSTFDGYIAEVYAWNRILNKNEITLLRGNRFCIFSARKQNFAYPVSSATFNPYWARSANVLIAPTSLT